MMDATSTLSPRYTKTAIALHWTIGLLIIGMLILGLTMGGFPTKYKFIAYNLHKSFGLTVLVLSLFRVYWRLTHRAPPMPASMKRWEKCAAHAAHLGLYFLMIAMPLSGWILVSADAKYPTVFFSLFEVPQFPLAPAYDTHDTHELFETLHYWFAMGAIGLIAAHFAAAMKHHFISKDSVLRRMLPLWLQRRGTAVL
jgi:cytochrome b561